MKPARDPSVTKKSWDSDPGTVHSALESGEPLWVSFIITLIVNIITMISP